MCALEINTDAHIYEYVEPEDGNSLMWQIVFFMCNLLDLSLVTNALV